MTNSSKKVELHVHIEATIKADTYEKLVKKYKKTVPSYKRLQHSSYSDITDLFSSWHDLNSLIGSYEDFEEIVYLHTIDQANQGVTYTEQNINVNRQLEKGLDIEKTLEAIQSGHKQVEKETGIIARVILSFSRDFPKREGKKIVEMVNKFNHLGVVGFDISGNEQNYPNTVFKNVLDYAYRKGVQTTIHAGEGAKQSSLAFALMHPSVKRVAHAVDIQNDPVAWKALKTSRKHVEINFTSNFATQVVQTDHPIKKIYEERIPFSINTDDPTLLETSLNNEFNKVSSYLHLSTEDINTIYKQAVDSAFCDEDIKEYLLNI